MAAYLCVRNWRWLACAYRLFTQRGMQPMSVCVEQYFAPASKLRVRARIARVRYRVHGYARPYARERDERVFEACGTWVMRAAIGPT